ncbi:MAG: hypothetical protein K9L28_10440 [Synergistales bacterium]|nr:hypothetical protein [Synergistales bacterium]
METQEQTVRIKRRYRVNKGRTALLLISFSLLVSLGFGLRQIFVEDPCRWEQSAQEAATQEPPAAEAGPAEGKGGAGSNDARTLFEVELAADSEDAVQLQAVPVTEDDPDS